MEVENSKSITPEAVAEDKRKKRQSRVFGLLVVINVILLVLFIAEMILIFTH